ncbi:3-phosphoserine/phosphohydroxythreonine transaminase [Bergeyella sp. RCAD1439]|uniref:3-phosphoserine/phosphohydroxythreonine transaminase n=1 Tax=Bergeyella anatis TaxID=3113737 RepID=UPI002E196736|nr:3-phosphoserine/phosphohydroxythreonine transaminase [Bergeyella sp. RCAD1439]
MKKHNFSAGPCILPQEVFHKSAEAVLDFNGIGLSLLEISHRSKDFVAVMDEARAIVKRLMNLNDDYEVLFLGGGASLQFVMVPFNLMPELSGKAAYLDTGTWAAGAIKEAQKLGHVDVIASSKEDRYRYIPKDYTVNSTYDYFHCTSNNTIYGTQMKTFPEVDTLMVCDMSSDIFSRQLDFSKFDLIYAGAQKNMGPAGVTLVVVKKEILGKTGRNLPSYLDYRLHIAKESMFNTPPVFPVYVSLLTLQHLEKNGGIAAAEKRNQAKAQLLYDEIDRNPLFQTFCVEEDRSLMNVSFNLTDESKKEAFDKAWKEAGINGLNGHRSLGGYRASLYNALSLESVQVLVDVMRAI